MWLRLATVLLAAVLGAGAAAPAPAAPVRTTAVGVGAREFSLSLYRPTVRPGTVAFNLTNFGEDRHNLVVTGPGGKVAGALAPVRGAGGRGRLEVRLARPGRYTLLCTIADHARRGMKVTLRVKR